MLENDDTLFFEYWTANRLKNKRSSRPFLKGLSVGFAIGIGILGVIYLGWYQRADMQVSSSLSPFLFLFAIMGLSVFMAFTYRNYQWEMKEQRYLSILARKKRDELKKEMQP